ncbi:hypothetical protein BHE74_00044877 [Ensete ventricosum]|nr:hypothetical protein GW17_00024279 [Ensete ventricosum]RWW49007.1 hypothetical protein BHE74_00044877 [Ensete ventricosum]
MGGIYWSVSLLVRGPPATERYRQKSTVGGRLKEIDGRSREIGDWRKREEEEEEKKKRRRNRTARRSPVPYRPPRVARALSSPARGDGTSPTQGDGTSPRVGRNI